MKVSLDPYPIPKDEIPKSQIYSQQIATYENIAKKGEVGWRIDLCRYLTSASLQGKFPLTKLKFVAVSCKQLIRIWIDSHPHWCVLNFRAQHNGFQMKWSFVEWILEDPPFG